MAATARPHERDAAHGLSHGPVPGSPTLTNPDMILPDYEIPDSPGDHLHSTLELWNDPNIGRLDFQLPPQNYGSGAVGPSTPIIYGNGTMLSDIGEVTEVESTVGPTSRRTSSRYSMNTDDGETYGTSIINKANYRASKMLRRDRSASVDSNSTITTQDHKANVPDFDDSVSVDDSCFQGDDEESMASSYVDGTALARRVAAGAVRKAGEHDEPYSTAYISERAEEILANAKRRLTAMEGNLTRARSSLAYSPNSDGSTPSPRIGTDGAILQDGTSSMNSHHSRIRSEDGIRVITKPSPFVQRSASALGSAGGYRPRQDIGPRPGYSATHKFSHAAEMTLEPLSEYEPDREDSSPGESIRSSYLSTGFSANGFSDRPLSRSASVAQMRDIQDQMQGLKGKISSLKEQARADSLKRRSLQSLRTPSPFTHARWDSGMMEPREIQGFQSGSGSSATPRQSGDFAQTAEATVPATNGEELNGRPTPVQDDEKVVPGSPIEEQGAILDRAASPPYVDGVAEVDVQDQRPMTPTKKTEEIKEIEEQEPEEDMRTENGDVSEGSTDGEEDYVDSRDDILDWESESGESTYHDSFQHQLSHEDREDAFDYEHFFLHSAMGSMSRQRSRRRGSFESSESDGSEDSVETTRGPIRDSPRKRRSMDTNASDDTFETATEGRASRSSAFQNDQSDYDRPIANGGGYDELPPIDEVKDDHAIGNRQRQNSVLYRPMSAASGNRLHRPSVSSFESAGTNRSFPLINRTKMNGGVLTPGGSPDPSLTQMSESLMNDAASVMEGGERKNTLTSSAQQLQHLQREDQIAVERLVASLGKCVLALGEGSRAGAEARVQRRRIDAARRILEGLDES